LNVAFFLINVVIGGEDPDLEMLRKYVKSSNLEPSKIIAFFSNVVCVVQGSYCEGYDDWSAV